MNWLFSRNSHQAEIDQAHETAILMERGGIQNYSLLDAEALEVFTDGIASKAGANVNEQTAMMVSAVYACVRIISSAIANLPIKIYERRSDGKGREQVLDDDLHWLLNTQPSDNYTAASMWEFAIQNMLLHGDGPIAILREGPKPVGFLPLPRSKTEIRKLENGRLIYIFREGLEVQFVLDQDDVLHIPNLGFNGVCSPSTLMNALKNSAGLAIVAEEYSALFFANGAKPDFALQTPGKLDDDAIRILRETWMKKHSGMGRHLPAVLQGGLDIKELTMNAVDSQLLESRRFQVIDIARIFGVPPHMIGENEKTSSWGSGIENLGIAFVIYTLKPHLTRIEQELTRKLFNSQRSRYAEFNVDALMRGDSKAQAEYFTRALGGSSGPGWMTPNEVRRKQNLPETDDGNKLTDWSMGNETKSEE